MTNEESTADQNKLLKSQIAALEQLLEVYEKSVMDKTDELYAEIAKRRRIEEVLRQSEERYRTILDEMEEWYFEIDLKGIFTFCNDILANALDLSREELLGRNYREFVKKDDFDSISKLFNEIFTTGKATRNFSYEFTRGNAATVHIEFSFFPNRNDSGRIIGFRGVGHDITERRHAEERIQFFATHDGLTGLPNRLMFSKLLNHAIESAKHHRRRLAVFFIDLDRFKIINDTMGHEAGDILLQQVSLRLKQAVRAADVVARVGGDEFVILVEEVHKPDKIAEIAHKVLTNVMKPIVLLGEECRVTASLGISVYPKDGIDEQTLMKNADIAMYFAKEEGKNNYQFFSKNIKTLSIERLAIETNLRLALERNEFSLHYQAKFDFKTNVISGVEALLRWNNPELGTVTPTQFIPVAEETGLIIPIGKWVLNTVCAQNVAWQKQGLPAVRMSMNLSPRQAADDNLIRDIRDTLKKTGMASNLLELEISESMVMYNPTQIIPILAEIKKLGVRLAIDDFGTSYSSLAQIKHFPFDTLKVDRSFIRNISEDAEDMAIAKAIITMGKKLSLTVVAEGVETIEEMNFLKENSCDEMQGYYFSKPISPDDFAHLLREHSYSTVPPA